MPKYSPEDLLRIHRDDIVSEFSRLGFTQPQVIPVTFGPTFPKIVLRARFASQVSKQDLAVLLRNIGRLVNKEVTLRDTRAAYRDEVQKVGNFIAI